jgi:predicted oxidoreductase (fatty acid repression mutant protein)
MSTTDALIQAAQSRRTIYKLGKNSPVPDSKIEELVNAAILNVPSSFNTQSTRLVVLLREEHDNLWDITIETFKGLVANGAVPAEVFEKQTLPKLQGFKAAYGTVCVSVVSISHFCLDLSPEGEPIAIARPLY